MTSPTRPLKVLLISRAYSPSAGGMERLSFELIASMQQQIQLQTHVIVNKTPADASLTTVRLRSLLFTAVIAPKAIWAARSVDIVHLGDPLLSKVGWLIKVFWRKPVVVTVHGLDVTFKNPLYRLYLFLFFRHFDAYIAISNYAEQKTREWKVTGALHVIPPGVHDRLYNPNITRDQLDQVIGKTTKDITVLLTTGRLVARKGHAWFVKHVLPTLPHTIYIIAGNGPERQRVEQVAMEANVFDRTYLLGRVSDEILQVLTNTVDIFIQPNISVPGDMEGFGIVLLEAALCRRPVIASDVDGISAAIHNGKNGYLVKPRATEAWRQVIESLSDGNNLKAREYTLAQFNWKRVGQQYAEVFAGLK